MDQSSLTPELEGLQHGTASIWFVIISLICVFHLISPCLPHQMQAPCQQRPGRLFTQVPGAQ